jgi:hypothetical protein
VGARSWPWESEAVRRLEVYIDGQDWFEGGSPESFLGLALATAAGLGFYIRRRFFSPAWAYFKTTSKFFKNIFLGQPKNIVM